MKRKLAMMLTMMCLIISMSTVSYAAEGNTKTTAQARATGNSGGIQPYYVNISKVSAGLKITGNTAYCLAEVFAKKVCFVNVTMRLQKKENGSWQTKSSWIESSTSGSKMMSKSFTLSSKGTYRVYVIATVEGEQVPCESNIVTY